MATNNSDSSSFSALLKAFRTRRRLTQQQLADKLGVGRNTIGTWERGDFLPGSKGMVLELARNLFLDDQETRYLLEASLTALAPHWLVPLPRNPFFTGREEILETLHTELGVERAVALTQFSALHGLGGVGKTQIALEYAYRYALEYSATFWIGAETEEQIVSSLLHIARVLQLSEQDDKDPQRIVAAVQRWLITHGHWLLVWDNVEDLALLDRFLPSIRSGAILITTRCQTLGTFARGLDLLPMEREEGRLFLLRRAKILASEATREQMDQLFIERPQQYTAAEELVAVLGGLPLALDQAGAYLEATQCGLPAYLDLFRTRSTVLLQQRGEGARGHPASVSTTFTMAINATVERHPAVHDLLQVCALLQPDAIPEELFRQGAEHLGTALKAVCHDDLEWNRTVAVACSYSLLSRQPEDQTLSLHRLTQAVLLDTMTEVEQDQWVNQAIRALDATFPEEQTAAWKQCERLSPHTLRCLHRVRVAEESFPFANLTCKVAQHLREREQYQEAEALFQHALSAFEQRLGTDHLDVALLLNNLAALFWSQNKYAEVESLYQRALHIREQILGPDHSDVACVLNNLATLLWSQNRYAEAEPLYQRALYIWKRNLGPDHPQVAQALNNLALLYWRQGRYAEAELLYQHALYLLEQSLGTDHLQVAQALNNLAVLSRDQGRYTEAEALYQRALHIREQALGPDHPQVATLLANLAALSRDQGKFAEAEALYRHALRIRERASSPDYPHMAESLNGLANLCREQGKYAEAEALYQRALHIRQRTIGPDHPHMAELFNGLANLYREQGKYAEAEALYQRALSIREQHLGLHHPETAETLHDLSVFRQKQSHLSEALSLAERALAIRLQSLGGAHPQTIASQTLYVQLAQEQAVAKERGYSEHCTNEILDLGKEEQTQFNTSDIPQGFARIDKNDPLQGFLNACCDLHPHAWCCSADLWQAYKHWVEGNQKRYPLSRGAFIIQLKAHGCRADRTMTARIWRGITVRKQEV